jgi:hypothetical protein
LVRVNKVRATPFLHVFVSCLFWHVSRLTPLEPTLLELGKWGSQFVPPSPQGATLLHASSYALTLKTFFRPDLAQGLNETYELHVGAEVLQVHIHDGEIEVQQGEALKADVVLYTDVPTYLALLSGEMQVEEAASAD